MFLGLPDLIYALSKWRRLGMYHPSPDNPNLIQVNVEVMDAWFLAQMALGLMAAVVVATRGRRLPAWLAGALFILAYNRLGETLGWYYQEWANRRMTSADLSWTASMLVSNVLIHGPQSVLGYLPVAASLFDFTRRDRPGRTRLEWAGLILGVTLSGMFPARYLAQQRLGLSTSPLPTLVSYLAAFLVALILVRATWPTWRRLLGER